MARTSKKSVYERIEDKKNEIANKEEELKQLNQELQILFEEQKKEEMIRLYEKMRASNLTIEEALQQMNMAN